MLEDEEQLRLEQESPWKSVSLTLFIHDFVAIHDFVNCADVLKDKKRKKSHIMMKKCWIIITGLRTSVRLNSTRLVLPKGC